MFNSEQQVKAVVNGEEIYNETLYEGASKIEFEFEAPLDGKIEMKFYLPDAVSPKELDMSVDTRELAINMKKCESTLKNENGKSVQKEQQMRKIFIKLNERYKIKVLKYKKMGKLKEKKIQGLWKNC